MKKQLLVKYWSYTGNTSIEKSVLQKYWFCIRNISNEAPILNRYRLYIEHFFKQNIKIFFADIGEIHKHLKIMWATWLILILVKV